jgi:protein-S-isoprenylcysteine O-methyltransferase Ste14
VGLPASKKILGLLFLTQNADKLRVVPQSALGALLALCGGAVRLACYHSMGKHFTFDVSILDHHKLVTSGPYGIVRHPGYTGALMTLIGLLLFHTSPGSLLRESELLNISLGQISVGLLVVVTLFPSGFLRHRMKMEDAALKNEFGEDWEEWAKKIPYWLVPGIY